MNARNGQNLRISHGWPWICVSAKPSLKLVAQLSPWFAPLWTLHPEISKAQITAANVCKSNENFMNLFSHARLVSMFPYKSLFLQVDWKATDWTNCLVKFLTCLIQYTKSTTLSQKQPGGLFSARVVACLCKKKNLLWTTQKRGNFNVFVTLQFQNFSQICAITMGRKKTSLKHCYLHGIVTCPYFLALKMGSFFETFFVSPVVSAAFSSHFLSSLARTCVKYVPKQSIP